MGRAITCQELNAYRRIPVFLNVVFSSCSFTEIGKEPEAVNYKQIGWVKMTLGEGEGKKAEEKSGRRNRGGGGGGGKLRGYCRPVL